MTLLIRPNNLSGGGIKWQAPPVHPEGRKFGIIAGAITLLLFVTGFSLLAWPMVAVTAWVLAFFRDPVRTTPLDDRLVVSPADGLVTLIQKVPPPRELIESGVMGPEPLTRVSIFMSVFDVHINRSPVGGTVRQLVYIPGKFINADLDKASEDNERQHIVVERADGVKVAFTQIAGLIARRIVPFVRPGDQVGAGQRVGLIRFGSRVDVYLPAGTEPRVLLGQRTLAGETVLAEIGRTEALTGIAN